ncbi:MAG: hypothetical protein L0216_11340 [Planctomycetales bacterium]|nr:hypothetical protein [Planctomycetales bacterium]
MHNEWVNCPGLFVVDRRGIVTYVHRGSSWSDRPAPETVLAEARKAGGR